MTDEARQEDREAADDVFDALSERYGVPAVYRTALANDFAAHASPLRTRIAVQDHALDCLVEFAKTAIRMLQGAEKDTGWGEPMFGDPNSEVMQKRLDEILARATLNGEKKHG